MQETRCSAFGNYSVVRLARDNEADRQTGYVSVLAHDRESVRSVGRDASFQWTFSGFFFNRFSTSIVSLDVLGKLVYNWR